MAKGKSGNQSDAGRFLSAAPSGTGRLDTGASSRRVPITDDLDEGRVSMGPDTTPAGAAGTAAGGTAPAPGGAQIVGGGDSWSNADGPGPQIMSADSLTGDEVTNSAGEDLGEIKDIMIDVQRGRIAYAVLSFGGVLGIGDKLFAVPWQALKLDADNKCFILDVDKERLKNAPGFVGGL